MKCSISKFYNEFELITLKNSCGMEVILSTAGAGIYSIKLDGKEMTLAPYDREEYVNGYQGKMVGRTAGRIENAIYTIDGKTAYLEKNNQGVDNLHSGTSGFHNKCFSFKLDKNKLYTDVIFHHFSPDLDGGHIGDVSCFITYRLYEDETKLDILIDGKTTSKALMNMTNHVFLNLNGDLSEDILNHELFINATNYGTLNDRSIVKDLKNDFRFDFRKPMIVGKYIEDSVVQNATMGYDHPFFLDKPSFDKLAASLYSPLSGIRLEVRTTYPVIVVYSDNQANPNQVMFDGSIKDRKYLAICLECQYHPNGVNVDQKHCGIFDSKKPYHEVISFKFSK